MREQRLDLPSRQANLQGAFICRQRLPGKHFAIVDDVMTTGASAFALADCLYQAGAERVDLWCCARTPAPGQA